MLISRYVDQLKDGFNRRFMIKATVFCLVTGALGSAFANSSFSMGFETQNVVRCLPQVLWILDSDVDISKVKRGSLVKLNGRRYHSYFNEETELLKMVIAMEGDEVVINEAERTLYINGKFYGLLPSNKPPAHVGRYQLKPGEIWIAGTSDTTIDSRYFGPATLAQIEAHAYAIL
jgi:type IV secretory pathway protease TraF